MLSDTIVNQKKLISTFEENIKQARENMSEENLQNNITEVKNNMIETIKYVFNVINKIYEGTSELPIYEQNKIKDKIELEKQLSLNYEENYKLIEESFQLSKEADERLNIDLHFDVCFETFKCAVKTISYIDPEVSNKISEILKRNSK